MHCMGDVYELECSLILRFKSIHAAVATTTGLESLPVPFKSKLSREQQLLKLKPQQCDRQPSQLLPATSTPLGH